jgi:hypothetical protein
MRGLDQLARQLDAAAGGMEHLAASAGPVVTATDNAAKSIETTQARLARVRMQTDPMLRDLTTLQNRQRTIEQAQRRACTMPTLKEGSGISKMSGWPLKPLLQTLTSRLPLRPSFDERRTSGRKRKKPLRLSRELPSRPSLPRFRIRFRRSGCLRMSTRNIRRFRRLGFRPSLPAGG